MSIALNDTIKLLLVKPVVSSEGHFHIVITNVYIDNKNHEPTFYMKS